MRRMSNSCALVNKRFYATFNLFQKAYSIFLVMISYSSFQSALINLVLVTLLSLGLTITAGAQTEEEANLSLGSIDFPTSVSGEAQQEFLTGVLALHSFWYPEARTHFRRARQLNPDFAMAYWGEALTHDHPIWQQHDQEAGLEVIRAMEGREGLIMNEREEMYINALKLLFEPGSTMDERRNNYAEAMGSLSRQYPEDDEALALWSLSRISLPSYDYNDPDVDDVVPVAADLEDLYQRNREHPGAMHYLIHLYDNEKFAELGLRPADDYAGVAYSSSHAIHMPSHIYKQLGMWEKVIDSNIDAWQASISWQQNTGRPLADRDYHSYSWLFDAYLQTDQYEQACQIIEELRGIKSMAEQRDEAMGRIPGTLDSFISQYESEASSAAPACGLSQ